jgi:hypothetical protein
MPSSGHRASGFFVDQASHLRATISIVSKGLYQVVFPICLPSSLPFRSRNRNKNEIAEGDIMANPTRR